MGENRETRSLGFNWDVRLVSGLCALVLVISLSAPSFGAPEMDVTFYGHLYRGTNQLDRTDTNSTVSVSQGTNVLSSCRLGERDTDLYVLPTPFTRDTDMDGWAHPGNALRFSVNDIVLPDDHIVTNAPGDDMRMDLHLELVRLRVVSPHSGISPEGTNFYANGTTVELTAPESMTDFGGLRHRLTGFTGSGSIPPEGTNATVSATITNDSEISWQWETDYRLEIATTPVYAGTIATSPEPDKEYYTPGESVDIAAVAHEGYVFKEWGGDAEGTSSNTTIHMLAPRSVNADFERDADRDRMCDDWELLHFGSISAAAAGPGLDADGDGFVNLDEEIAGTNPRDNQSYFHVEEITKESGDRLQISWSSVSGRQYRILIAEQAEGPWQPYPDSQTIYNGDGDRMQVSLPNNATSTSFIRMEVRR